MAIYEVVPDDRRAVAERLATVADAGQTDVVLTVGGTGVRPTDWVPEATRDVIEKEIPGIGEAMRQESIKKVKTAMLSRGTAGIRGGTLIVNLTDPGSKQPLFSVRMDKPIDWNPATYQATVDEAVAAIFEKYPSGTASKR